MSRLNLQAGLELNGQVRPRCTSTGSRFPTKSPDFPPVVRARVNISPGENKMLKVLLIGSIVSLTLVAAETAPTMAGVNIDIGGRHRISCREGANIVADAGYWRVRPIVCGGREYRYRGMRHHRMFAVTVS